MPHSLKKKQRLDHVASAGNNCVVTFDDIGVDVMANIFSFLELNNIMSKRCINKKATEAVTKTIVPPADFRVENMDKYNAMNVMARAMPNLQQITLHNLGWGSLNLGCYKWSDGEDPDERWTARTADWTTHNIEIISNFSKLRILTIDHAGLNGRYPVLFNSFPLLQKLSIKHCHHLLKWDLEMLAGLPLLKFESDQRLA
jgi:hypothetical protein